MLIKWNDDEDDGNCDKMPIAFFSSNQVMKGQGKELDEPAPVNKPMVLSSSSMHSTHTWAPLVFLVRSYSNAQEKEWMPPRTHTHTHKHTHTHTHTTLKYKYLYHMISV